MIGYQVAHNPDFMGREFEKQKLLDICHKNEPAIITVYGRRRVGKTELLEQFFKDRNLLKFEGIENASEAQERQYVLDQAAEYFQSPLIAKIRATHWIDVFKVLLENIKGNIASQPVTLYFEELQWLCAYKEHFIAELKYMWDNHLRHIPRLLIILCGSSHSFMIERVIKSKSLYNRSQYTLPMKPFSLAETRSFLNSDSNRDVMDAYLTVGGIPEYLKYLKNEKSIHQAICKNSFIRGSFLSEEYDKIFVGRLSRNPHYEKIIRFLSLRRYASREEIIKHLKIKAGGSLSTLLHDMEQGEWIIGYRPYECSAESRNVRYSIADPYLQFYFKFINPVLSEINNDDYHKRPSRALNTETYYQWLGYSFERLLRRQHRWLAKCIGFCDVKYRHGAYFKKGQAESLGCQIDLVCDRSDRVLTLFEFKYNQIPLSSQVITEFGYKLEALPVPANKTIQKVLVTAGGVQDSVAHRGYFDRIITLDEIFHVSDY